MLDEALNIAKKGLELPSQCQYSLGRWTKELAEELGDRSTALSAQIKAFEAQPSFEDYIAVQELAGTEWLTIKEELLRRLESYSGWGAQRQKVKIFLHESLIERAIAIVDRFSYDSELVHLVMKASITSHPDWVITNASHRAESIMDAKQAQYYHLAVEWLEKVKAAYLRSGQEQDWLNYLSSLKIKHGRKYKLMRLLAPLMPL